MITQPTNVADVLAQVAHRLAKPEHWTKGYLAKDDEGLGCQVDSPQARCWCLDGALLLTVGLQRVTTGDEVSCRVYQETANLLSLATDRSGHGGVSYVGFNDRSRTTHGMVLEVIARARELATS